MRRGLLTFVVFAVVAVGYTAGRQQFAGSPSTTTNRTVGWCVGPELASKWIDGTGAAGTLHAWIKLTSVSNAPCRLPAYVDMTYRLSDGSQVTADLERLPSAEPLLDWRDRPIDATTGPVVIAPSESVAIALSFPNDAQCPSVGQVQLEWTGGSRSVLPTYLVSQCNGTRGTVSRVFAVPH